jgi:RNA polymerase sigma factor (TIGR02999 family)
MDDQSVDVQRLSRALAAAEHGDAAATSDLFDMLYSELRRLAKRQLHVNAAASLTLGATTLLHEAYLDMAGRDAAFPDRARFFAYAARAMRGLIIDYVRERRALKRGAEFHLTSLDTNEAASVPEPAALTRLDEALADLAQAEPALAELVDLKYFCGFTFADIAAMRNVTERTVQRNWAKARLYLHDALHED